jgi:hypothetical protein
MHDTDTALSSKQPSRNEKAASALSHPAGAQARKASAPSAVRPQGLIQRLMGFFARIFAGNKRNSRAYTLDPAAAERVTASLAAQMSPPMAFKGDTTSTLATPMGAYAGKPVSHAIRKRAEQQFNNMDISNSTMN